MVSLFAGIGGFDLGGQRAGMECVLQAEQNKDCSKVLASHWPDTQRVEDVRDVGRISADVVVGGFPCQDLSVAGRRAGLAGERSGLWWEFHRIVSESRPPWVVIENVPGLLSSNRGRDMGAILGGLGKLGYGFAYRVLDSQWFGLAQRRQRVFIVGSLGNRRAAQVLFEPEGVPRDSAPSRAAREEVAGTLGAPSRSGGFSGDLDRHGAYVPEVAWALQERDHKGPDSDTKDGHLIPAVAPTLRGFGHGWQGQHNSTHAIAHTLRGDGGFDASEDGTGRGTPLVADPISANEGRTYTHEGTNNFRLHNVVPFDTTQITSRENRSQPKAGDPWHPLAREGHAPAIAGHGVRRLTPTECARLQGFPDDWLEGLGLSDSAKYRALGNAVSVPVVEWILRRIVRFA